MLISLFMIFNSFNLIFLNHTMSMGLIIIIQTILISLKMSFMLKNSWFSFIIFIMMVGGMMIMFIYMSSIASNEKFKLSKKMLFSNLMITLTFMLIILNLKTLTNENMNFNEMLIMNEEYNYIKMFKNEQQKSIIKFLSLKKFNLMMLITSILLMILMFINWMNFTFKGPLKKTYE
uniref:NADH-ubiquinone oxidoreductase chain 6 n=1 Tax=Nisia fuliginosa TaxID=2743077 RepID=A0A8A4JFR6_9HEMI|nr:NADH dehydrogenase subunit 6 [Nisia fuliginosa]